MAIRKHFNLLVTGKPQSRGLKMYSGDRMRKSNTVEENARVLEEYLMARRARGVPPEGLKPRPRKPLVEK